MPYVFKPIAGKGEEDFHNVFQHLEYFRYIILNTANKFEYVKMLAKAVAQYYRDLDVPAHVKDFTSQDDLTPAEMKKQVIAFYDSVIDAKSTEYVAIVNSSVRHELVLSMMSKGIRVIVLRTADPVERTDTRQLANEVYVDFVKAEFINDADGTLEYTFTCQYYLIGSKEKRKLTILVHGIEVGLRQPTPVYEFINEELIKPKDIDLVQLAADLVLPLSHVKAYLDGTKALSVYADTAFCKRFGLTAGFFLRMQERHFDWLRSQY